MPEPELGRVLIDNVPYLRPVVRVAVVTYDGTSCTMPVEELLPFLEANSDFDGEYGVRIKTMRASEFERLPEFTGF